MNKTWWDGGHWRVNPYKKGPRLKQFFIVMLLAALVLFEAFQSVAIMGHRARLDVLEAPPEVVYPDIAIDTTVGKSPMIYTRHKTSLKYKTRAIYAIHNQEDKDNG